MFKTANEVYLAIRKRQEEEAQKQERVYEKIRKQIEEVIEQYIAGDSGNLICHFDIPYEIQQELAAAGYLVLHFVEGYGYDAYLLKWDAGHGGIGEFKGDKNKLGW